MSEKAATYTKTIPTSQGKMDIRALTWDESEQVKSADKMSLVEIIQIVDPNFKPGPRPVPEVKMITEEIMILTYGSPKLEGN